MVDIWTASFHLPDAVYYVLRPGTLAAAYGICCMTHMSFNLFSTVAILPMSYHIVMFQLLATRINRSSKRRMPITGGQVGVRSIYKVRVLRRETLLWIIFLNKVSTPLSRSTMTNSNSCSCSSSHATLLFWNVIRDHLLELVVAICFDRRYDKDSSMEIAISLASASCLITLHLS